MFPGPAWTVDIVIATVTAVAALVLLIFYSKLARERTSRFTLGLAFISLVFFVQNIAAVLVYFRLASTYTADVALPIMAIHSMELVGIGAMVWMARQ